MGKITLEGPVPKDHPMFTSGPEMFSRPSLRRSVQSSQTDMAGTPESEQAEQDPNLEMKPAMDAHEAAALRILAEKNGEQSPER